MTKHNREDIKASKGARERAPRESLERSKKSWEGFKQTRKGKTHANGSAGREIPERSQRDPREIPERFIVSSLCRKRTPKDPESGEIPERSQRDPKRDPTPLHCVSGPRISPPRLKLYNVYTQEGWGPAVFQHCMDPSASDGCTCQSPCNFGPSPF